MLLEDTKILLVDGKVKRIKDLNINDYLLCIEDYLHVTSKYKDIDNFKVTYSKLDLIENIEYDELYYINDDKLRVLYSETIFIKRNDEYMWMIVDDLLLGDYLVDYKKRLIKITSIIRVKLKEKKRFYTIKMSKKRDKNKFNTFFANGVLIHNSGGRAGFPCGRIGGAGKIGGSGPSKDSYIGTHDGPTSNRSLSNSRFTGWYSNFTESEVTQGNVFGNNTYAWHNSGNKTGVTYLPSSTYSGVNDPNSRLYAPTGQGRTKATYAGQPSNQPCQDCGVDMDGIIDPFSSTGSTRAIAGRFAGIRSTPGDGANRVEWACLRYGFGWQIEAVNDIRLLNIAMKFQNLHGDIYNSWSSAGSRAVLMYIYQTFVPGTEFGQNHTAANPTNGNSSYANYDSGPHMYPPSESAAGNKRFNLVGHATFIAPSKSGSYVHEVWTNTGVTSSGSPATSGGPVNSYFNHSTHGRIWRGFLTNNGTGGVGVRAGTLQSFVSTHSSHGTINEDMPTWQYPMYTNNGWGDSRGAGSGAGAKTPRIANSWNNRGIILSAGNEYLFLCGYSGTAAYGNWLTPYERYNIVSSQRPAYNRKGRYTRVVGNDTTGRIALGQYFIGTYGNVGATYQFGYAPSRGSYFERTSNSGSTGIVHGGTSTTYSHRRNFGLRNTTSLGLTIHGPITSGGSDYWGSYPSAKAYYSNTFHNFADYGFQNIVAPASASGVAAESDKFPVFKFHSQRIGQRWRMTTRGDSTDCEDKTQMDAAINNSEFRIH